MSKIAVITMGVRLEGEQGYTRFRYISDMLVDAGHKVDLITTTFQHWQKKQRDIEQLSRDKYKFDLKFFYECSMQSHISWTL